VVLGVRPEQLVVADVGPVSGTVSLVEPLGPNKFVWFEVAGGSSLSAVVDSQWHGELGQRIAFNLDVPRASLFDAKSQARL
jgi:multiple sugar transport system ATP-binding protein